MKSGNKAGFKVFVSVIAACCLISQGAAAQSKQEAQSHATRLGLNVTMLAEAQKMYEIKIGSMVEDGLSQGERGFIQSQLKISSWCMAQRDYYANIVVITEDRRQFEDDYSLLSLDLFTFGSALQNFDLANVDSLMSEFANNRREMKDNVRAIHRKSDEVSDEPSAEMLNLINTCKGKLNNIKDLHGKAQKAVE